MTIAALILAAGLSERMEGDLPKQLLPFGGHTLLGHVVATAESTELDPIVVVTGYRAAEVAAGVKPLRARLVHNPNFEAGNLSSLRTGLGALPAVDAVMLLLADMPGVDAASITKVAGAWLVTRPFAAVATYLGEAAHPFVLSAGAMAAAVELEGNKPLWHWLRDEHATEVLEVELGRPRPRDINTMDDYAAEVSRLSESG